MRFPSSSPAVSLHAFLLRRAMAVCALLFLVVALGNSVDAQSADSAAVPALDLTEAEKAWMEANPVIRLGADPAYPPFEFFDSEGLYKGIATDYLRIIEERTGLTFVPPVQQSFGDTIRQAMTREVDLLVALNPSDERKRYLVFSDPYLSFRRMILMRDDAPAITGLTDLAGKRIGILRGTTDAEFLAENAPDVAVVEFDTGEGVLLAISSGDVDAATGNGLSAVFIARQLGLLDIKVAAPASLETHSIHFAARNDWPELISIINKALATVPVTERNEIQRRWSLVQVETQVDYSLIWKTALAILPIFLIVLAWAAYTRQQQVKLEEARDRLRDATLKAQAANKAKSTFLANMSHEMRTPLTGIIGFLGLIRDAKPERDIRENVDLSLASAHTLLTLINDLLDLARLESGATRVEDEVVDITQLLRGVKSAMAPLAQEKNLALTFIGRGDLPALVHTDPKLVRQIVTNLVGNAVKFTDTGQITIELLGDAGGQGEAGDQVSLQINVHDTGVGIREEDKARLLRRFEQVHSLAEQGARGTGLGLAICQELVTLLRGRFFFDSTYGKGSTFSVVLPCRMAEAGESAGADLAQPNDETKPPVPAEALAGAEIYLADDNRIISALVEKMLSRHGVHLTHFENGKLLYERLQTESAAGKGPPCDLVLMDIHMPEMNGVDAQKAIRKLGPAFAALPIVALTANAIKGERENYLAQGMDSYISKPIDPDLLLSTIAAFLTDCRQAKPVPQDTSSNE